MEQDHPPKLNPSERPTPAELKRIAQALLSEMARDDPMLARAMLERKIDCLDSEVVVETAAGLFGIKGAQRSTS